jgi:hypothetical protein
MILPRLHSNQTLAKYELAGQAFHQSRPFMAALAALLDVG